MNNEQAKKVLEKIELTPHSLLEFSYKLGQWFSEFSQEEIDVYLNKLRNLTLDSEFMPAIERGKSESDKRDPSAYARAQRAKEIVCVNPFLNEPEPDSWWFDNLILHNGSTIVLVHGQEKVGKSWICYQMAIATALGTDFMGYKTSANITKVLILSPEGGLKLVTKRLWGLADQYNLSKEQRILIGERIMVANLDQRILTLTNPDDFLDLKETIDKYDSDVIILDPMIEFADPKADENSNPAAAFFMSNLRRLGENKIIVLSHHNSKGGTEARGASSILGKYDHKIGLEKIENDSNVLQMKMRFSSRDSAVPPMKKCTIEIHPADGFKNYNSVLIGFSDYTQTTEDYENIIIEFLTENKRAITKEINELLTGRYDKKLTIIKKLIDKNIIRMIKEGKNNYYELVTDE